MTEPSETTTTPLNYPTYEITLVCPECGCEEFDQGEWRPGNFEHICKSCGQSWFPDIAYSPKESAANGQ